MRLSIASFFQSSVFRVELQFKLLWKPLTSPPFSRPVLLLVQLPVVAQPLLVMFAVMPPPVLSPKMRMLVPFVALRKLKENPAAAKKQ